MPHTVLGPSRGSEVRTGLALEALLPGLWAHAQEGRGGAHGAAPQECLGGRPERGHPGAEGGPSPRGTWREAASAQGGVGLSAPRGQLAVGVQRPGRPAEEGGARARASRQPCRVGGPGHSGSAQVWARRLEETSRLL